MKSRPALPIDKADAKAVKELVTMITETASCRHTPTRSINTMAYERAPTTIRNVKSVVEGMDNNISGQSTDTTRLRHNDIISRAVSDIMCMIDIGMAYDGSDTGPTDIVCMDVSSGRHMGMMVMIFEILTAITSVYRSSIIHMCITDNLKPMSRHVVRGVPACRVHDSTNQVDVVNDIMSNNPNSRIMIMCGVMDSMSDVNTIMSYTNAVISMIIPMIDPTTMSTMANTITNVQMVMEMPMLSDPDLHCVRLARAILIMYGRTDEDIGIDRPTHWSDNYECDIDVDINSIENPV